MSRLIIVEGNSNDKDNVRAIMVKGEKGDMGDLNHNDIIDNLTSTATDKVLSANQGKELKDLADKKIYFFNSISEMKTYDLKAGDMAITNGYNETNDGGGSIYKIRLLEESETTDDMILISLSDNSLVAELIIYNDEVNIKQLGADETVTNDTKALKCFASSTINKLIIPSGNYLLNDTVDFSNKELIGIGNPTIDIIGITTSREHTIHISDSCYINGINFEQSIAGTNIMGLFSANDTLIENCSFKVNDVKCNGYFDLYTNNHNIKVLNCDFDCTSTETVDEEKVNAIGGIWVRQYHSEYTSDNIIFENCIINHQSKDEALGVWNDRTPCLLSNVQINNCIIKDKDGATNPHLITFSANNSSINNCILERIQTDTTSKSSIIHQSITYGVPITINNCVINTNIKHANGIFNTGKCIINNCEINDTSDETRLINQGKIMNSVINCNSFQNQYSPVTLENCELNMTAQTHSWLFRKTCTVINNTFNFITANPTNIIYIVGSSDTGFTYFLKGNVFNYYNNEVKNLAHLHNTSGNKFYAYDNINMGEVYDEGTNTGAIANNIITEALSNTSIKTNNNFNINA